ncbi:hypothetical protein SAMN05660766_3465 [Curtobacterium sp. 314Chir4.1]|uniref:hypothetical protein n=1 Tax=Curtobacterium sp. 314Chir4.1 TaxID=1279028 RepID=UPI000BCBBF51|nr:hypothetical protein [Curtobacterium sp. 314Chir4.1]SOC89732.1 hypothetical protein SAMN05660766_3465 [Curtobacterium sp. 314Chir4.1]
MKHTTRSRRTVLAAAALLCALPLALSACSSASEASSAKDATAGVGAKWGACMRDAGFEVEDPDDAMVESGVMQSPPGAAQEEFERAGARCAKDAGVQGSSTADQQEWERESANVASCIRENGYEDLPVQRPGVLDVAGYPRAQEAAFQKLLQECNAAFAPGTTTQNVG